MNPVKDYALVYVTLRNFRKHKNLDLQFDGKSYVLVGDTGEGKSSILEALLVAHKYKTFPKDALSEGAKEGAMEIGMVIKGENYRIICDYDETGRGRWRVKSEGKGSFSLDDVLREMFTGLAKKGLNGAYFDYAYYFYECKSPKARFEYLMECIVGDLYNENEKTIVRLEKERGGLGTRKALLQSRLSASEITDKNYEDLAGLYKKDKDNDAAKAKKEKALEDRLTDLKELNALLEKVKFDNLSFKSRLARIKDMTTREEEIAEQIRQLQEQLVNAQEQLLNTQTEKAALEKANKKTPQDIEKEVTLSEKLTAAQEGNEKIENEIEDEYEKERSENETFNLKRQAFLTQSKDYLEAQELGVQWKQLDDQIKNVKQSNISTFKEKLDLPLLEIREVDFKEDDPTKGELHVYYKGRELNIDNISKGESIQISTKIQEHLNPAGFRLITIPEAQSLGSALPEIVEEAHKQGYQIIAEFTEPHRQLEAVIVEDFLEEKATEEKVLADLRKKRKKPGVKNGDKEE